MGEGQQEWSSALQEDACSLAVAGEGRLETVRLQCPPVLLCWDLRLVASTGRGLNYITDNLGERKSIKLGRM